MFFPLQSDRHLVNSKTCCSCQHQHSFILRKRELLLFVQRAIFPLNLSHFKKVRKELVACFCCCVKIDLGCQNRQMLYWYTFFLPPCCSVSISLILAHSCLLLFCSILRRLLFRSNQPLNAFKEKTGFAFFLSNVCHLVLNF